MSDVPCRVGCTRGADLEKRVEQLKARNADKQYRIEELEADYTKLLKRDTANLKKLNELQRKYEALVDALKDCRSRGRRRRPTMSDRMTDERLAEIDSDPPGCDWHSRYIHATCDELLQALKAEREYAERLQATLDRVRGLPGKWRLYSEPSWSNHDCAYALDEALKENAA